MGSASSMTLSGKMNSLVDFIGSGKSMEEKELRDIKFFSEDIENRYNITLSSMKIPIN